MKTVTLTALSSDEKYESFLSDIEKYGFKPIDTLSFADFCREINISDSTLNRYVKGAKIPFTQQKR